MVLIRRKEVGRDGRVPYGAASRVDADEQRTLFFFLHADSLVGDRARRIVFFLLVFLVFVAKHLNKLERKCVFSKLFSTL